MKLAGIRGGCWTLVSVVSDGASCPHNELESSARVDNLKDWIDDTIAGDE